VLPRSQTEIILTGATLFLVAIGIYMVFSASAAIGYLEFDGDANYFMKKQLMGLLLGIAAFIVLRRLDYHLLSALSPYFVMLCLALLVLVLFIGVGPAGYDVQRWLKVGPVFIQPSELSKLVLALYIPQVLVKLSKREGGVKDWRRPLPFLLLFAVVFALIAAEPDMSMAIIIMVIALTTLFVGGVRLTHIAALTMASVPFVWYMIVSEPYRFRRIFSFLDPWADPAAGGYQAVQSLISIGSGKFFGLGLCASRQKLFYLPAPHTDFIFAVLGEETGFWGTTLVVTLFLVVMIVSLRMAVKAKDRLGGLLAVSLSLMITVPALVNMGMVVGLLPVTGIPLPFISYGGSSLAVSLAAMGVLCNIAHQNRKEQLRQMEDKITPRWMGV